MIRTLFLVVLSGFVLGCSSSHQSQPGKLTGDAPPLWTAPTTTPDSAFVNAYALLIGIGQYAPDSQWEPLQTQNDLRLMRKTLLAKGFQPNHILTITDQQATREGLIRSLQQLTDSVRTGSKVVVLYAGHGQQLADDDGDEPDGLDEAIVPYDAPKTSSDGRYRGERHLRDDEVNRWVIKLRQKAGPTGHVLLLFDSCYAGTMTRSRQMASRGGAAPIGSRQPSRRHRGVEALGWAEPEKRLVNPPLATCVLMAATVGDAPNFEYADSSGTVFGPLTLAVCRAWERLGSQVSYRAFFEEVRQVMTQLAPYQQPGLAGDADAGFLGWLQLSNERTTRFPVGSFSPKRPQYELARQPTRTDPEYQLAARLVRVRVEQHMGHTLVTDTLPPLGQPDAPVFTTADNERMILLLDNRGTKPFYVALMDLPATGNTKLLLPETDRAAAEYRLLPGQRITRRVRVTKPFGLETYTLFLTPEPVDPRALAAASNDLIRAAIAVGSAKQITFRVVRP